MLLYVVDNNSRRLKARIAIHAENARMKKSIVNWELIIVSNVTILLKKLVKVELNHFWKLMWNLIKILVLIATKIFWNSYKYKFMVGDGNNIDATDIILNFEMYNEMNFIMS